MGFQSGINATLGSIAGAAFGIQKTLQQRQEAAAKKVKQKQQAQKKQKRNFISYLKEQPVAGSDKKVGQLGSSEEIKALAAQYSKYERQKLMNTEDAKNK